MNVSEADQAPKRSRTRRVVIGLLITFFLAFIAGELVARYGLGLGDPPLEMEDPELDYCFVPAREYMRFGNRVAFNSYSMRSDEFPKTKVDPTELRVLVLGDSIVYGTTLVDQSDIATEVLQRRLHESYEFPVQVGNVSAGSWGPANLLAYVEKYGFFDADYVFVVVNMFDAYDEPEFIPIEDNPDLVPETPTLALQELLFRYVPRFVSRRLSSPSKKTSPKPSLAGDAELVSRTTQALQSVLERSIASGARTFLVLHPTRDEVFDGNTEELEVLAMTAERAGAGLIDLGEAYRIQIEEFGVEAHRGDRLHLEAAGQAALGGVMGDTIESTLFKSADGPTSP